MIQIQKIFHVSPVLRAGDKQKLYQHTNPSNLEQDGFPKGLRPFGGVQRQRLWQVRAAPGGHRKGYTIPALACDELTAGSDTSCPSPGAPEMSALSSGGSWVPPLSCGVLSSGWLGAAGSGTDWVWEMLVPEEPVTGRESPSWLPSEKWVKKYQQAAPRAISRIASAMIGAMPAPLRRLRSG